MLKSKTLFVIGAGASHEAGLPVSDQLKSQIADRLNILFADGWNQSKGDRAIVHALKEFAGQRGATDINGFINAGWQIRDALPGAISIDNYMDAHRHDLNIQICGKLGIAQSILEAESSSKLGFTKEQERLRLSPRPDLSQVAGTWYESFFQLLHENIRRENLERIFDNVSFIIFNYDRCVEHYLYYALQDYYNISPEEACALIAKVKILHPYGLVGRLIWQDQGLGVSFGGKQRLSGLLSIATQIKTFTERIESEPFLQSIHTEFAHANTVVFLGFAFHDLNMKMLSSEDLGRAQRIFATAKGISKSDVDVIKSDLEKMFVKPPATLEISNELTCQKLFTEYRRSLSR